MEVMRQLDGSSNTNWNAKHNLLQAVLEGDADRQLNGVNPIDDVYWSRRSHGQTPGRASLNKTPFFSAVAKSEGGQFWTLRLSVIAGIPKRDLTAWTQKFLHPDAIVVADGLACGSSIAASGGEQQPAVSGVGAVSVALVDFRWLNTSMGNLKNALRVIDYQVSSRHLLRYQAKFY